MPNAIEIRPAMARDMREVADIYGHHVSGSLATFELEAPAPAEMARRCSAIEADGLPYLVAEGESRILGFAYVAPYRSRPAYRGTVENSVYVAPDMTRQGVGTQLLRSLIDECQRRALRQMVAIIGGGMENTASIRLHARCGFVSVGVLTAVGRKFDRAVDTLLMQRAL
jgi:phosphinothricin acetyltransferase